MKRFKNIKRLLCTVIVAVLMFSLSIPALADYPKAESYIADSASVLAENTVRALRKSNETMKNDYGVVVAVCTVKTTDGTPIADYARAVFTEWKMGEGVLLLIVSEDQDYYIVQSTGLRDIITNEQLRLVRNDYLEPDFATGNIDRGVQKSATKLTSIIERALQKKAQEEKEQNKDGEGTTAGKIIVTILIVFLCVSLGGIALFAILFVVALFNDPVADFMSKYIFNRKKKQRYQLPVDYYDERLYGQRQPERSRRPDPARQPQRRAPQRYPEEYRERPRQNPAPAARQNPQNRMRDEYNNQRQNHADVYYNADGTVRRAPGAQNPQRQRPAYDETRTFSIPEQNRRR